MQNKNRDPKMANHEFQINKQLIESIENQASPNKSIRKPF